jgi:hypothetical protein
MIKVLAAFVFGYVMGWVVAFTFVAIAHAIPDAEPQKQIFECKGETK